MSKGYTLVELIIVLALIASLATAEFAHEQQQQWREQLQTLVQRVDTLAEQSKQYWLNQSSADDINDRWPNSLEQLRQNHYLSSFFADASYWYQVDITNGDSSDGFAITVTIDLTRLPESADSPVITQISTLLSDIGYVSQQPASPSGTSRQISVQLSAPSNALALAQEQELDDFYKHDGSRALTGDLQADEHSILNAGFVDADSLQARTGLYIRSDIRHKDNVEIMRNPKVGLHQLQPLTYTVASKSASGFSAQKVAELHPYLVDASNKDELYLNYVGLVPELWRHVQLLDQKVDDSIAYRAYEEDARHFNFNRSVIEGRQLVPEFNASETIVSFHQSSNTNLAPEKVSSNPSQWLCAAPNRAVQVQDFADPSRAWLIQYGNRPINPQAREPTLAAIVEADNPSLLLCHTASPTWLQKVQQWMLPTSNFLTPFNTLSKRQQYIVRVESCALSRNAIDRCPYLPEAIANLPWQPQCGVERPRVYDCAVPIDLTLTVTIRIDVLGGDGLPRNNSRYRFRVLNPSIDGQELDYYYRSTRACGQLGRYCFDAYRTAVIRALRGIPSDTTLPQAITNLPEIAGSQRGWRIPFWRAYHELYPSHNSQEIHNAYQRWIQQPAGRFVNFLRYGYHSRSYYQNLDRYDTISVENWQRRLPSCARSRWARRQPECAGYR